MRTHITMFYISVFMIPLSIPFVPSVCGPYPQYYPGLKLRIIPHFTGRSFYLAYLHPYYKVGIILTSQENSRSKFTAFFFATYEWPRPYAADYPQLEMKTNGQFNCNGPSHYLAFFA